MSVQSQIDRLNAIKARIRTNLIAQGVTVPDDAMLEDALAIPEKQMAVRRMIRGKFLLEDRRR